MHLLVAQQLADHRQGFAQRQRPRGEAVPEIVNAHVVQARAGADEPPGHVEILVVPTGFLAGEHPGASRHAGQPFQHAPGGRRNRHGPRASLGVAQLNLPGPKVHLVPAQGQNLALAAAGQHQQPECPHNIGRHPALGLELAKRAAQAAEFLVGEKTLAAALLELAHEPAGVAAFRRNFPQLGHFEQPRQQFQDLVGHDWRLPQAVMQRRDAPAPDLSEALAT
ncbi:MAG: hypothetical protein OXF43_05885 [Gammaproteobacteria bacterium]|nr:hypothetical protein [Gammaproteobacteria bacterium]